MLRLSAYLALLCCLFGAPLRAATEAPPPAATTVTLEGQVQVMSGDSWADISLGQLLGPGDRVRTLESSSLHLVLADGSSLALGPNTELTLQGLGTPGSGSTIIQLFRGALHAIVEKLTLGAVFEVQTANAVAAVKGTEFVVDAGQDDTAITVAEGEVQMGDLERKSFRPLRPLDRCRLRQGRWGGVERLSKREAGPWAAGLERDRRFHGQRTELLQSLRGNAKEQRGFERLLEQRRERREKLERIRRPSGEARERRLERLREARERRKEGAQEAKEKRRLNRVRRADKGAEGR